MWQNRDPSNITSKHKAPQPWYPKNDKEKGKKKEITTCEEQIITTSHPFLVCDIMLALKVLHWEHSHQKKRSAILPA